MRVIKATAMGLCFGVRDALGVALAREDASEITIYGELVHNEEVLARLRDLGYAMSPEEDRKRLPDTRKVIVTAHGISEGRRAALEATGRELIDTTCPLVARVHKTASRLAREGYDIVLIGRPGHVEVRGITEDLPSFHVVARRSDVRTWPGDRLAVICQTTTMLSRALEILQEVRAQNPEAEVRFVNTICEPTRARVDAVEALIPRVDAMVVVGGRNSNNTRQLVLLCEAKGLPVHHVQSAAGLRPHMFRGVRTVGLTAGTSTSDETVEAVYEALSRMGSAPHERRRGSQASLRSPSVSRPARGRSGTL